MMRLFFHVGLVGSITVAALVCTAAAGGLSVPNAACASERPSDMPRLGVLDEPRPVELDHTLEFTLMVGAWIPRFKGDVTLDSSAGAAGTRFELGPDLHLDDLEPTVLPELAVRKDEIWEIHVSGFRFSTSSRSTIRRDGRFGEIQLDAGDTFHSDVDLTSASGELRIGLYRAYTNDGRDNATSDGRQKVDFRFAPLFGLRYVEVEHAFERTGGLREDVGGTWVVPYGGFRMELTYFPDGDLPIIRMLRLEAGGALGPALGADGGFAWQVRAGLTCNVTDNLGVMFGYRLLELEVESGAYELNGGLQGLFLAGSLRF